MSADNKPSALQASVVASATQSHTHKDNGKGCCDSKAHPVFEAVKSGMLIPLQSMVEQHGLSILSLRDDKGHTPTHWASLGGHTAVLRYMIENKVPFDESSANDLGAKPIHWACVNGHIAIVDILTQAGVDLDAVDNKHCTPLIVAAQYGQVMLAGYLMGKGARLQLTDKDGDNALHWAAFKGHSELMRLLIYSGFNPKQKDNYGQTALHLASINGNITAVQELCEQDGMEISTSDNNGKTPFMLAQGRKHDEVATYLKKESQARNSMLPRIDCWAIIFGPPGNSKMALLFYVCNIVLWGYPMYLIKCLPVTWYDLQYCHLIFMFMNVIMWICLYHANSIDPGFLPRNIPEYDQAIKQVAHFDEWKQGQNPLTRLCHTCRTVKPLRAKHCRICNRCVKEFDHHCPYIHNCVGYNNRVSFCGVCVCMGAIGIQMFHFSYHVLALEGGLVWYHLDRVIGLALALLFLGIALCLAYSTVLCRPAKANMALHSCLSLVTANMLTTPCIPIRISFMVFALTVTLGNLMTYYFDYRILILENFQMSVDYYIGLFLQTFCLGVSSFVSLSVLAHAARNITTNERINHKRYNYLKDGKGAFYNPFDRGIKLNLMEFFHLEPSPKDDEVRLLGIHVV